MREAPSRVPQRIWSTTHSGFFFFPGVRSQKQNPECVVREHEVEFPLGYGVATISRLLENYRSLLQNIVSFAEYSLFYRALLQKRPMILRSLLFEATHGYTFHSLRKNLCDSWRDSCDTWHDSFLYVTCHISHSHKSALIWGGYD